MDDSYDVQDSTDWLATPLKDFALLENALHCQICKEFYDTPMITSCNHTFCSKCIRTSLSAEGKCPACRSSDQASKLRNNLALQEVVSNFLVARPPALEVARRSQEYEDAAKRPGKRKRAVVSSSDAVEGVTCERTTRSKSRRIAAPQGSQRDPLEIEDSEAADDESIVNAESNDGLVACPICGKRMKEVDVYSHLDNNCQEPERQARTVESQLSASSGLGVGHTARPQDRINELTYSMMKETALSRKLKEIGIPNWGSKQLMTSRHKEWVNIWNANCDSAQPRSKRDLLRDLDVWEKTQGGKAPHTNGSNNSIMRKDFDADAYGKKHHEDFSKLIANAKRKKPMSATEEKSSNEGSKEDVVPDTDKDHGNEQVEDLGSGVNVHDTEANSSTELPVQEIKQCEENGLSAMRHSDFADADRNLTSDIEPHSLDSIDATHRSVIAKSGTHTAPSQPASPTQPNEISQRRSSNDEHITHVTTGSPCEMPAHLFLESAKKVPMFSVPTQSLTDIDGGGGGMAS